MKNFFKYLWIVFSATVALLFLLEASAWLMLEAAGVKPKYSYYASYMNSYKYHPYMAYHPDHYPVYLSPQNTGTKSAPTVVLLGGSTAAGVGPRDQSQNYFLVMERALAEAGHRIDLQNFAAPGLVSNQEHAAYEYYLFPRAQAPRLLLSLTSFNDIYFYLFRPLKVGNHEFNYAFETVFKSGYPPPEKFSDRAANAFRRSSLYYLLQCVTGRGNDEIRLSSVIFDPNQPNFDEKISDEKIQSVANNFLSNVLATALLAKSRGTKYLVVIQPMVFYGGAIERKPNEWFSTVEALSSWVTQTGLRKPDYDRFFRLVFAGLEDMKKKGLVDYLDYRAFLQGDVFLDPVHFNEVGSRALGEKMAKDIAARL